MVCSDTPFKFMRVSVLISIVAYKANTASTVFCVKKIPKTPAFRQSHRNVMTTSQPPLQSQTPVIIYGLAFNIVRLVTEVIYEKDVVESYFDRCGAVRGGSSTGIAGVRE